MQEKNIDNKRVSIIIPYHKNKNVLKLSLTTLEKSLSYLPEIIIIANNIDESQLDLELDQSKYKIYKVPQNLFWPGAINFGVSKASNEIVVFCDPDIFYWKNWLDELLVCYKSHKNAGAVSAKLLNPQNNRIMDFGMFYNNINVIHSMKGLPYNHPITLFDRKVSAACGAILLTEKTLFNQVGGIDTDMPYIYCDNDYCLKISALGKETWIAHKAIAYHIGDTDGNNSKYQNYSYLREDSKAFFYAKKYMERKIDYRLWLNTFWHWYLENTDNRQQAYILFDFCTLPYSEDYIEIFQTDFGLNIIDIIRIILPQRNISNIKLYSTLPVQMIDSNVPFIYFVDSYDCLIDNAIFFKLRDITKDLIIDKNGNIINFSDIKDKLL